MDSPLIRDHHLVEVEVDSKMFGSARQYTGHKKYYFVDRLVQDASGNVAATIPSYSDPPEQIEQIPKLIVDQKDVVEIKRLKYGLVFNQDLEFELFIGDGDFEIPLNAWWIGAVVRFAHRFYKIENGGLVVERNLVPFIGTVSSVEIKNNTIKITAKHIITLLQYSQVDRDYIGGVDIIEDKAHVLWYLLRPLEHYLDIVNITHYDVIFPGTPQSHYVYRSTEDRLSALKRFLSELQGYMYFVNMDSIGIIYEYDLVMADNEDIDPSGEVSADDAIRIGADDSWIYRHLNINDGQGNLLHTDVLREPGPGFSAYPDYSVTTCLVESSESAATYAAQLITRHFSGASEIELTTSSDIRHLNVLDYVLIDFSKQPQLIKNGIIQHFRHGREGETTDHDEPNKQLAIIYKIDYSKNTLTLLEIL